MIATSGSAPRQLLLVEDNPGDADLIVDLLAMPASRDRVAHVTTLGAAVERLRELEVDAVLLDLGLPDASGVECVVRIRAHVGDVPIVVLTGLDDDDVALRCIGAGAQDYLSKQELRTPNLRRAVGYAIARASEKAERRRADALQARLAAIVEASSDAIVSSTVDGVITSWNSGAEKTFGYGTAEAVGRPAREILRAADGAAVVEQERRILELREGVAMANPEEMVRLHKDGSAITLSVMSSVLRDALGQVIGLAAICRDVTEAKRRDEQLLRMNEELVAREAQMRALTARINSVREEERTRISREVHDELGQLLTGLKMDLRWVERRLSGDASLTQLLGSRLSEAERLVDRTIETVQRIAVELRPSALDALGLAAAVRDEARRFQKRTSVIAEVQVRADGQPSEEVATALFRVLQELLTNVARHAQATRVGILLSSDAGTWTLRLEDNGVGMPDPSQRRSASLGLLGIRERVQALGGSVRIEGADRSGTVATVVIGATKSEPNGERGDDA